MSKSAAEIIAEASERIGKMAEAEGFEAKPFSQLRWLYPGRSEAIALLEATCSELGADARSERGHDGAVTEEEWTEVMKAFMKGMMRAHEKEICSLQTTLELQGRDDRTLKVPVLPRHLKNAIFEVSTNAIRYLTQKRYFRLFNAGAKPAESSDKFPIITLYGQVAADMAIRLELLPGDCGEITKKIKEAFGGGFCTGKALSAPEATGELPEKLLGTPLTWHSEMTT
jgi:hypothetical protein